MKTAFLLIGASGSGKSTVRQQIKRVHPSALSFSLDDVRVTMYGVDQYFSDTQVQHSTAAEYYKAAFDYCNSHKKEFDELVTDEWNTLLRLAEIIVCDNTHTTRKSRERWVTDLKKSGFVVIMVEVLTPLSVILKRQETRGDKSVPAAAVISQHQKLEPPTLDECDSIITVDGTKAVPDDRWMELLKLPAYEPDNGPLSDKQIAKLRELNKHLTSLERVGIMTK